MIKIYTKKKTELSYVKTSEKEGLVGYEVIYVEKIKNCDTDETFFYEKYEKYSNN